MVRKFAASGVAAPPHVADDPAASERPAERPLALPSLFSFSSGGYSIW